MKKSELKALKEAFNIPEPERKDAFKASFKSKLKKNEHKPRMPIIIRYTSAAAAAAAVIGMWGSLKQTKDISQEFDGKNNNIISETSVPQTEPVQPDTTENTDIVCTEPEKPAQESSENIVIPVYTLPEAEANHAQQTETSSITPAINKKTDTVNTNEPPSTNKITSVKPVRTTVKTSAKPVRTTVKTSAKPVQTTLKTSAKPVQTTVKTSAKPVQTTVKTSAKPVQTTVKTSAKPVQTTIHIDTPEPTEPIVNAEPKPTEPPIEPTEPDWNFEPLPSANDYTITPDVKYTSLTDKILNIYNMQDGPSSVIPTFPPYETEDSALSIQSLINDSDLIVKADLVNIIYTQYENKLYTLENLDLNHIMKTYYYLKENDKISIYIPGGYMPIKDYAEMTNTYMPYDDDYTVYDPGMNKGVQKENRSYVFFLKKGGTEIPDGAYALTYNADISVFEFSNGKFVSIADNSLSFTLSELREML